MLAFLHAAAVGQPLKQAVVGLDFFGFNMFFPRNREQLEARFAGSGSEAFATYLATELANRPRGDSTATFADVRATRQANRLPDMVSTNADVPSTTIGSRNAFLHPPGTPPIDWNEAQYLRMYPDVAAEVKRGTFQSGYHHYLAAGRAEGREDGNPKRLERGAVSEAPSGRGCCS